MVKGFSKDFCGVFSTLAEIPAKRTYKFLTSESWVYIIMPERRNRCMGGRQATHYHRRGN